MPLHKVIHINSTTTIFLWKITETFEDLFNDIHLNENNCIRLKTMRSELHQRAFLSVRKLLHHCGYTDFDLIYDLSGKPYLKDGKHISITHSHTFSAIVLSDENIGIDLEMQREKIIRIADKFANEPFVFEIKENKEDFIRKLTVIWGIKEAIFKIRNEEGISFKDHIQVNSFEVSDRRCSAELHFKKIVQQYDIFFEEINSIDDNDANQNYTLVCALENR
ncbi:4'-phosphopantetheinyl transferase superfamily protein [Flavobacterium sp.]|uniref:4'-phosphopantetheinyl transferase family protein n=1 Tax=Flavobacterium sp. TaxID=239 RepID=UPI0026048144|nr:4'-phosphopantetheinyl transferase superfamily protein [Flavobacterium sp.]